MRARRGKGDENAGGGVGTERVLIWPAPGPRNTHIRRGPNEPTKADPNPNPIPTLAPPFEPIAAYASL